MKPAVLRRGAGGGARESPARSSCSAPRLCCRRGRETGPAGRDLGAARARPRARHARRRRSPRQRATHASASCASTRPASSSHLLNSSAAPDGSRLTAKQWAERFGLVAAINASLYQTDHRTSVSLMKSRTHTNNPRLSQHNAVLLFDRLDDGRAAGADRRPHLPRPRRRPGSLRAPWCRASAWCRAIAPTCGASSPTRSGAPPRSASISRAGCCSSTCARRSPRTI